MTLLAGEVASDNGDFTEEPEALTDPDKSYLARRTKSQEPGKSPNIKLEEVKSILKELCAEQKASDDKSGNCDQVQLVREMVTHSMTTFGEVGEESSCNSSEEEERDETGDESAEWSSRETSPTDSSDEIDMGEVTPPEHEGLRSHTGGR